MVGMTVGTATWQGRDAQALDVSSDILFAEQDVTITEALWWSDPMPSPTVH